MLGDVAIRTLRRGDVHTICLFGHLHAANVHGVQLELQRNAATGPSERRSTSPRVLLLSSAVSRLTTAVVVASESAVMIDATTD